MSMEQYNATQNQFLSNSIHAFKWLNIDIYLQMSRTKQTSKYFKNVKKNSMKSLWKAHIVVCQL